MLGPREPESSLPLYSPSFLEEFFSETEMSVNTPAINIQSIVLRRKRRNVILQPFAIVGRRERGEKKGATQHLAPGRA
jgi:hypothetical protein